MGLLNVQSNRQLVEAEDKALKAAEEAALQPQMLAIAAHIRSHYAQARQHKDQHITPRLLHCQQQKAGAYDPETLSKIERAGGCKDFFNISETKTDALEAWINDAIAAGGEIPFALLPTPEPDLPDERKAAIVEDTVAAYELAVQSGFAQSPADVYEAAANAFDLAQEEEYQQAKARADAMEAKIRDQMFEGGFTAALDDCIRDYAMYPTVFLKGPVLHRKPRLKWVDGAAQVVDEVVHTWERVDPHKMFPGPNIATMQEGYVCELLQIDAATLQQQRENPGWSTEQINAVLAGGGKENGFAEEQSDSASSQAALEGRDSTLNAGAPEAAYWGVEYWGKVQGSALIEWGLSKKATSQELEANDWYEVSGILIGIHVVRCILNPHPLGKRPYHIASFVQVSGTVWGRSMLEKMRDAQKGYNNTSRQMMNALAEASRVRSIVDVDALDPTCPKDDFPGKQWMFKGQMMNAQSTRKPVEYWQASVNVMQYLKTLEHFEQCADNRTLVPRYQHGDQNIPGGAGKTASGLSMLMGASHKGIKRSIGNIDNGIIRPTVEMLYAHNLVYLDAQKYAQLMGDCRIEARGALYLIQKETLTSRREAFLSQTNNPTDLEIIGIEGRAEVLRSIASELNLNTAEVVPDRTVILRRMREQAKARADAQDAELAGGVAPPADSSMQPTGQYPQGVQ